MLDVRILDEAQEILDALSEKHRHQIVKKIALLAQQPYHPRSKQLEGYAPLRRMSSGEYRIVYFIEGKVLKVPLIDKRGDNKVYRRLKQLFG
ncbi:type II toxin-antitoxin system RelE/ParE family toxin [Candidatus Kaiserbacteria bacterium]|nr:type II toxin-antitoxin system RelE/ParE family toxin [Candidatus Kaiserbacteria bacterium]